MPGTYDSIATVTIPSTTTTSISFSNIPQNYTDLVLQINSRSGASAANWDFTVNGDSSASSSWTRYEIVAGVTVNTGRISNYSGSRLMYLPASTSPWGIARLEIFSYSNTNVHKAMFNSVSAAGSYVQYFATIWRSTNAITSIQTLSQSVQAGTTFALYGIKAA